MKKYLVRFRENEQDAFGERRYYVNSKVEAEHLVFEILRCGFWAEVHHINKPPSPELVRR